MISSDLKKEFDTVHASLVVDLEGVVICTLRWLPEFAQCAACFQTGLYVALSILPRMNVSAANTSERVTSILVLFFAMDWSLESAFGNLQTTCKIQYMIEYNVRSFSEHCHQASKIKGGLLVHCWAHHGNWPSIRTEISHPLVRSEIGALQKQTSTLGIHVSLAKLARMGPSY